MSELQSKIKPDFWKKLYTTDGQTQSSELLSKVHLRYILNSMINNEIVSYSEASTQRHGDFKIIYNTTTEQNKEIILECKKTDSKKIMCNDTIPSSSTDYLIFYTAAKNNSEFPQIILINGSEIITQKDLEWIKIYQETLQNLKILVKKNAHNHLTAYPRPNWQFDISRFLTMNKINFY